MAANEGSLCPYQYSIGKNIQWLCQSNPQAGKKWLGAYDGDQLVGYAIIRAHAWQDISVLECLDIWWDSGYETKTIGSVACYMIQEARKGQMDFLLLDHFSKEMAEVLQKMGFLSKIFFQTNDSTTV